MKYGKDRESRAGPARGLFSYQMTFELQWGFPAVTVKELNFSAVAAELAGFLRGETDAAKMGTKIWLADAKRWHDTPGSASKGPTDMGKIYGAIWRDFGGVDQLQEVVDRIKTNPTDRRLLVSAWNPPEMHLGCLPPCHYAFQFYVTNGTLSCMAHMRSVDCFLGLPFDIASYALLVNIVGNDTGLRPGRLTMTLGDTHIYVNHFDQVKTILEGREGKRGIRTPYPPPKLLLDPAASINNFTADMAALVDYKFWPAVRAPLNVGQVG
jgi:thymidylate synthase